MEGYWLWAFVIVVGVFAMGGVLAFATARYSRTHGRRSAAEKRASEVVTEANYRDPVAKD